VQEVEFESQLLKDGHLYCPREYAVPAPRPFGLCKGDFLVPDDFDAPLPEYLIKEFEG